MLFSFPIISNSCYLTLSKIIYRWVASTIQFSFRSADEKISHISFPTNNFVESTYKYPMRKSAQSFLLKSPEISFLILINFSHDTNWKLFKGFKLKAKKILLQMSLQFYPKHLYFLFKIMRTMFLPYYLSKSMAFPESSPEKFVRQYSRKSLDSWESVIYYWQILHLDLMGCLILLIQYAIYFFIFFFSRSSAFSCQKKLREFSLSLLFQAEFLFEMELRMLKGTLFFELNIGSRIFF